MEGGKYKSKAILLNARGEPPATRVCRETKTLQKRLSNLCRRLGDEDMTVAEFLTACGHNMRLAEAQTTLATQPAPVTEPTTATSPHHLHAVVEETEMDPRLNRRQSLRCDPAQFVSAMQLT